MIELDGSSGEGGGQILRTALTLSMITGQPFRIKNIRVNRARPGLMRQHLVAVQAAASVCSADVNGAAVGAPLLEFVPGKIEGGHFKFAIGSAGSCTLVLQTLLPALLYAGTPSVVRISGGTHNPMAPPLHFLQRSYGRILAQMGASLELELHRFGFYPVGGGAVTASVQPCPHLIPVDLMSRGELVSAYAESFIAGVPLSVAQRELECVGHDLEWDESQLRTCPLPADEGPGNALLLTLEHANVTEVFSGFGEKTVRAESVARSALQELHHYVSSGAAVGEHLADQIMLPFALAGAGRFTTNRVSQHALTNAATIERFLPVTIGFKDNGDHQTCVVTSLS